MHAPSNRSTGRLLFVGMGMGLKFTSGDSQQLSTLEKWVGELSGKLAPEPELPQSSIRLLPARGNVEFKVLNDP